MKNTMNFAAKTAFFALFAFFLLNGQLFAASDINPATQGCHKDTSGGGCDTATDAQYNTSTFHDPVYAPSWTEVTSTGGRVRGGQYLVFTVQEGEIYTWSTEGREDIFYGQYAKACTADNQCRTASDTEDRGLRCVGGYCLLPFDTELTLIKDLTCSASIPASSFLAYSNSDGFRNQSELEWKATFSGPVTLLVTNYEYQTGSEGVYKACRKTSDLTTTVKWHRTSSEHCQKCGDPDDYQQPGGNADSVAKAPSWTTVEEFSAVSPFSISEATVANWIKPGSYLTFDVKENEIYRWSTCKSDIHDTQLTLFKGAVEDYDGDSCGEFLAYNDDSKVSYVENSKTYCPAGTRQTVLEWKANFTGQVTLLFNEYNCYQCAPQKDVVTGENHWLTCFDTVVGNYKATVEDGVKTIVVADGIPVVAPDSCNPSLADSECVTASYIYAYPLQWQRYDCWPQGGGTESAKIADYTTEAGWENFGATGGSQVISSGYVSFSLKRGSKYLFKTSSNPSAIITIKKGLSGAETIAQGVGQLTYFANSDTYSGSAFTPDLIRVYVSDADCNAGSNTLDYSYYTDEAGSNVSQRFEAQDVEGSYPIVTDSTTQLQFIDTGRWATTWQKALKTCQEYTVGSEGSSDVFPCPPRICPSPASKYTDIDGYFCEYSSSGAIGGGNKNCKPPVCPQGSWTEFLKNSNEEDADIWGKCYYSGTSCDAVNRVRVDRQKASSHGLPCKDGETNYRSYCYKCPDGYEMEIQGALKVYCNKFEEQCDANQICVTKGGACTEGITEKTCPDDSTEYDGKCVSNTSTSYPVYQSPLDGDYALSPIEGWPLTSGDGEACPEGTTDLGDGTCEYDGCGEYANYIDFQSYSGKFVLKKNLDEDPNGCYSAANTAGGYVPCCCSKTIKKFKNGNIQAQYAPGEFNYATSLNPNGTVSTISQWTCQEVTPCPAGYTPGDDGVCYTCEGSGGRLVKSGSTYKCYPSCAAGETEVHHRCYKCPSGYTLEETEGGAGVTCVKECPDDAYLDESTSPDTCYTNIVPPVERCIKENGWIQDPDNVDRCKKLKTSGSSYVSVACSQGELQDNDWQHHCDTANPNSTDCHCYYDYCEVGTREADKKICPTYYCASGNLTCNHSSCFCLGGSNPTPYVVTPVTTHYVLNGETIEVVSKCQYTDASGQTCEEAMSGWTLPNINQLYSIVDFDLYNPATAYPFKGTSYNRDADGIEGTPCEKTVSTNAACSTNSDCGENSYLQCSDGKCITADPFGDLKCDGTGRYLCIDGKCARNNWYWSSTTVVSEKDDNGEFTWAVNMEDGRSYRAKKGCVGDECAAAVDLNARPHHVLCIKGATIAGIFDSDLPMTSQTFSGWACDKSDEPTSLTIYFEITDSDNAKDVVALLPASDNVKTIPGLINKGIKYGTSDILPTETLYPEKKTEIFNNCGFPNNPAAHAFEVKWKEGEFTEAKAEIAELIRKIQDYECDDDVINDPTADRTNCGVPPYFVTAYAINESSSSPTPIAIAPTKRPFVFKNRCGDGYMTYDGDYTENCESENFETICGYNADDCQRCARTDMTVSGETVRACMLYNAQPPKCMDGILQSYYCVDSSTGAALAEDEEGVIAEGHTGAGLACVKYNFAKSNNLSSSEECDCSGGNFYYYSDPDNFNCSTELSSNVCPNYNTVDRKNFNASDESNYCYICAGCKRNKTMRPRCGDGVTHRPNCSGYTNCQVVQGANEECDDNNDSDTDSCTNQCKKATCGDGFIQPSLGEMCDSGPKNGYYETNCASDDTKCPGCASITCGVDDTEKLGPRCGDGMIQNRSLCNASDEALFVAAGYASKSDFLTKNNFADADDCYTKLQGAAEKCDLGKDEDGNSLNGRTISFEDFLNCLEDTTCNTYGLNRTDCAQKIGEVWYPVNNIHAKFPECVFKYKKYIQDHPGCSPDCTEVQAPYCGNGGDKLDPNEICDQGLPTVTNNSGVYAITGNADKYNGKEYGSCRLDCLGTYKCNNAMQETSQCAGVSLDGKCPDIGSAGILYVDNASEGCDDGALLNGTYGHCDENCKDKAYCGNRYVAPTAEQECIIKNSDGSCSKHEECDFGHEGKVQNKTSIDLAYSLNPNESCIAEPGCNDEYTTWGDKFCCVFGRYCGDGSVDNGLGLSGSTAWKDISKWDVTGAALHYDAHNMALRFTLTGAEATAELNELLPVDEHYRYFLEFDLAINPSGDEHVGFDAGANEYDNADPANLLADPAYVNASPYYFVDVMNPSTEYISNYWYHAKNSTPIKGLAQGGSWSWYKESDETVTKNIKVILKMQGAEGTDFIVRGLTFYNMETVTYNASADGSSEMCDAGDEFATASSDYMSQCGSDCKWINYCGDKVVQRYEGCGADGKYNGFDCVNGISGAAEVCDDGQNKTNTYNGCEPGCLALGPRCGDGVVDCNKQNSTCHYAIGISRSEQCDNASNNNNNRVQGPLREDSTIGPLQGYVSASNYGTCRSDCRTSRCGDGIWDKDAYIEELVPKVDENGNPVYDTDDNGDPIIGPDGKPVPEMVQQKRYLEECDCGTADAYFDGVTSEYEVDLNAGKEGLSPDKFFICKKDDGTAVYNTNNEKRKAVCRPNCTVSKCGDGIIDKLAGEECDDGNDNDHDSCTNQCKENKCGDGNFAYTRSYLCEELKGMTTAQLQKMAQKGVIDCDGSNAYSCAQLESVLTSDSAIADKFDEGILHCCYNAKLRYGDTQDDRNCEFKHVVGDESKYLTPKQLAVKRCNDNGFADEEECKKAEQIERCDRCLDGDCGCSAQYPEPRSTADEKKYKACLDFNRYCITSSTSPKRCWNILGKCGDGKKDTEAGEKCDNYTKGESNTFFDLDNEEQGGGAAGIGGYCTGECRGGGCNTESPLCISEGDTNCWEEGCTHNLHKSAEDNTCPSGLSCASQCGDGYTDLYAMKEDSATGELIPLEECDEGNGNDDSWSKSYCDTNCKKNKNSAGEVARCGDKEIQDKSGEVCDDGETDEDGDGLYNGIYCVNDCTLSYGSCGDGNVTGPGFTLYDSLKPLPASNGGTAGPEYCDYKYDGNYSGDARSVSLGKAGATNFCVNCGTELIPYTCGDKTRNPRFEGCDFGTNNDKETLKCTAALATANNTPANGSVDDFGRCNAKTAEMGRKCYKGCKSDAIGGLIKASSLGIYGWACDPDHPMYHKDSNFVFLRFYDKDGNELEGSPVMLPTNKKFGTDPDDLTGGEDYYGYDITENFTVRACGGGEKHGWLFDPSKASGVTFVGGPYTVKAYALSLDADEDASESNTYDGENHTYNIDDMVFLGSGSFAMAMSCGDKVVSKCDSIQVKLKNDEGNAVDTVWANGRTCKDDEIYGYVSGNDATGCQKYGLENNKACKDEQCDNGKAANGDSFNDDRRDCDHECQWTKCGDGTTQDLAGQGEGLAFRTTTHASPSDPEECDQSATKTCTSLLPAAGGEIKNNAPCNNSTCKWNFEACYADVACPALDQTDMYKNNTSLYKLGAFKYIRYVNGGGQTPTYTRKWTGDKITGSWSAEQTKPKYKDDASGDAENACAFECVDDLVWKNGKCVGKDDETAQCLTTCDDDHGVWLADTTKKCGGSWSPTFHYKTKIDDTGNVVRYDSVTGDWDDEYTGMQPEFSDTTGTSNCPYKCETGARHVKVDGTLKCQTDTLEYTCKYNNATTFAGKNMRWVKVWKQNGKITMARLDAEDAELKVTRNLQQPNGVWSYIPSTADLDAHDVNDASYGIIAQQGNLSDSSESIRRCFYTCKSGYSLNDSGECVSGTSLCGNGIINSEHCENLQGATVMTGGKSCKFTIGANELCDDGGNNGKYKASSGGSYCKSDCGVGDKTAYETCVASNNDISACDKIYGRIKGGLEYSCGDNVVQCKDGDTKCSGTTVNGTNYPGAILTDFNAATNESEQCDGAGDRKALCDRYLKMKDITPPTDVTYYETSATPGCESCKFKNVDDANCGYCGDGKLQSNETCGDGGNNNYYGSSPTATSGTAKARCAAAFNVTSGYKYYINIPGVYCFTAKGGDGNKGDADNACSGATVKGCYKLQQGDKVTFRVGSVGESRPADSSSVCSGTYSGGGGGGASWVYLTRGSTDVLLLVAGGGGGGGWYNNTEQADHTCGGGSNTTSANNNANNTADNCTDNSSSDGATVNTSNFASITAANGGDGGYHYTTKCSGKECDSKYACGGGGGGYVGGAKGTKDYGGGGGGSYVNTNTTYYSSGSSLTAGTNSGVTPSAGSITVQKPTSNATCSTSNCQWSSSYSTCN